MNPYKNWTEDQQCKHAFAKNSRGMNVTTISHDAVQWCALGWLAKERVSSDEITRFSTFFREQHHINIPSANDEYDYSPRDFEKAWDEFEGANETKQS